ncbi:retrotransposon protein, putative, ty1-copia subclass, partial [Tanacetum coccineum]
IVLSIEDKLNYLEQPLPPAPVAHASQQVAPEILAAHTAWQAEQELLQTTRDFHSCKQEEGQSISSYVLKMKGYIENLEGLGNPVTLGLALHEQTLPKNNALALHAIQAGKVQKGKKHKKPQPQMAARGQNQGNGKNKHAYAPKPKIPPLLKREDPAKDSICHACGETGHWKRNYPQYLAKLLKKKKNASSRTGGGSGLRASSISWIYDTGCGTHIYNTTQGLRASRKLKSGALSLYVGNGQREAVEAIGNFDLSLLSFWDYALETAARILNMVPTKKVEKTPYEVWHGQAPKLSYLKVWGCEALVKRDTLTKPDKLEPRSIKCIFIGYPKETMGYSFYYPPENKVLVAQNAEFLKNSLINQEASGSLEDLEIIQEEDMYPSIDTSLNHKEDDLEMDEPQSDIIPIRRSTRTRRPTDRMCLYIDAEEHELGDLGEPANYKAALLDPESDKWLNAMNVEMQSMKDNEVWILVELPPNGKTVGSKWLFKKKTDMDGAVHTYKARLVAKGYTQTPGIDYEETFSPVADIRAIRILIAIAAYYDYEIWQMDVKTAFLNGYLNEEVYMEQPEGFVNPKYPNRVCKLKRSIYGLKQASRQWNKRFDDEIKKFGFSQNADEPCVYLKASGSNVTFLILYVDDILIMGNSIPMLQDVKSYLGKCFAMKDLGEAAYILGIKIYRDRSRRLIGLCQSAYIEKILKRFHMENSKRGSIPMQDKLRLSKSQGASTPAELKRMQSVPYASAVGSIMYAVRCTRPDVAFAQNITSRFQQNPGDLHWTTVKNILKYLRNTKDMFLVYGGDLKRELRVSCYTDAGYLTDADDLKSQTGYVFVLNGGAVDWKSAKQSIFATSSAEAEYIAAFDASKEAVWVRKFISGLGVVPTIEKPINMYCDNTGAIAIANESGITKGARHFRAKVHYLREVIEFGDIKLEKVHTDDNLADPFTKALAFPKHSELTRNIGMLPASSFMFSELVYTCCIGLYVRFGLASGRACLRVCVSTHRGDNLVTSFSFLVSLFAGVYEVIFVAIYAPQSNVSKRILWDYICVLISRWDGETLLMGDFNVVRTTEERFGSVFDHSGARDFNHFILSSGLVEVKMEGYSYTWSLSSAEKMSKLDRFLVSEGILSAFPSSTVVCLDRHLSDHRPILLKEMRTDFGPSPFRIYHSWFKRDGFDFMVEQAWSSFTHSDSNSLIRFKKKLQDLKKIIRGWIKDKNISLAGNKVSISEELAIIDRELDRGVVSDDLLSKRMELTRKLRDLNSLEAKDLAQKAKVKWAIEGDENSKFFHGLINKKRSQLSIRGIFVDGDWITDPLLVKDAFKEHFASRFMQPDSFRLKLKSSFPKRLSPNQVSDLDSCVTRSEIRNAVWECGENKSPGPDGFSFEFFRRYWNFIGPDFCSAIECFFTIGFLPKGCNASFIALIPKVLDAKFVSDFRPISLIGSVYKVITKILANRLAPVISDIVSDSQSAFIANRSILDGPFILNEIIAWCKRKNKQALIFKVDFAKAYDSVRWDYLLDVLIAFGFGPNWCKWIRGILSSAMASILVNGSPTSEFPFYCGLKQGDPLAPFLFILIMESLHISVSKAVDEGVFKGLSIQGSDPISHLFYADDAVFVGEWSEVNLVNLVRILDCFYLASGLKINLHKSQVLGVGVPRVIVDQGASLIGCDVLHTPFKYLGVTVGDCMSRCSAWVSTVQKIKARLSKWKSKTLSVGGRLTLLKSVLGAVPLYTMSLYKVPKGVLLEMESIRSNFFKGGDQLDKKITWVAWDKVLSSKKKGGLGVSSLFALNRGLILKWVWRFLSQDGSIWSRVISAIYGPYLVSHDVKLASNWCSILREVQVLNAKGFDFISHCKKSVAPSFRSFLSSKARDGVKEEQMVDFISMLDTVTFSSSIVRWVYDLNGEGEFRVKDIRSSLDDLLLPSMDIATRWVKFIPIKINVFAWQLSYLIVPPTRHNLIKEVLIWGVIYVSVL